MNNKKNQPSVSPVDQINQCLNDPGLRLQDHPDLLAMAQHLIVCNGEDPALLELFSANVQQLAMTAQTSGDPFHANPPARGSLVPTEPVIIVGKLATEDIMFVPTQRFRYNTALVGRTGSSKTTLAQWMALQLVSQGVCVIVIERKRGWRKLLRAPVLKDKMTILNLRDFALSLLQPVPNQSDRDVANQTTRLVGQAYALISAQRLFREVCSQAMAIRKPQDYPRLKEIIERVRLFKAVRGYREIEYNASVFWTLTDLDNHIGEIFDYSYSDFMEKLTAEPRLILVETHGLPGAHLSLPIGYLQTWCFARNLINFAARAQPIVFILEDATTLVDAAWDHLLPGGTSLLCEMMALSRELNIGTILICHGLGSISPKALQNVENIFLCSLQNEDPRRIQQLIGSTPEQAAALRLLPAGSAVGLVPSVHPQPVVIKYPKIEDFEVPDEECQKSAKVFLAGVHCVKNDILFNPGSPSVNTPGSAHGAGTANPTTTVSPEHLRVLVLLMDPIPLPAVKLYQKLGFDRKIGSRVVGELEVAGLVALHQIPTGRKGAPLTLLELTEGGWKILDERGFKKPEKFAKGGWLHNLAVTVIRELGLRQKYTVDTEVKVGGLFFDARWRSPSGQLVFWQVGISSPEREGENIVKAIQIPAVVQNPFYLVVRDREFANRVENYLRTHSPAGGLPPSFNIRLIGEFLTEYYT